MTLGTFDPGLGAGGRRPCADFPYCLPQGRADVTGEGEDASLPDALQAEDFHGVALDILLQKSPVVPAAQSERAPEGEDPGPRVGHAEAEPCSLASSPQLVLPPRPPLWDSFCSPERLGSRRPPCQAVTEASHASDCSTP